MVDLDRDLLHCPQPNAGGDRSHHPILHLGAEPIAAGVGQLPHSWGWMPRMLVWDNESAVGQRHAERPQLSEAMYACRGTLHIRVPVPARAPEAKGRWNGPTAVWNEPATSRRVNRRRAAPMWRMPMIVAEVLR
jgi:hypothetical protein